MVLKIDFSSKNEKQTFELGRVLFYYGKNEQILFHNNFFYLILLLHDNVFDINFYKTIEPLLFWKA